MSISPLTITGVSSFSDDFQTVLQRAVSIARIPVTALQNEQGDLLIRKQLTTSLRDTVETLGNKVASLASLGANRALTATSSNVNRVSVSTSGANTTGTYTITDITSIAKAASENTATGLESATSTQVDPDAELELVFGGQTYNITLTDNSLNGLRDAINELGIGVVATVLNTGTGATPFHLSLTAVETGQNTLELRTTAGDSGSNLLTQDNQGSNAVFKLNGLDVENSENQIADLIEGVSLTIVSTTNPGESVTIGLASNKATLATALSEFVTAYNNVRDALGAQVGEQAGLLSGEYLIRHTFTELRGIAAYSSADTSLRLSDLGIELNREGKMTFNQTQFYSLSSGQLDDAFTFLGTESTGFGAIVERLETITDPITGMIKAEQNRYDDADARITERINEMVTRIEYMQASLVLRLQQADTILASLESQQKVITASVQGLELTLYGRRS